MGTVRPASSLISLLPWRRIRFIGLIVVATLGAVYCLIGLGGLIGSGWVRWDDWALLLSFVASFWVFPLIVYVVLAYAIAPLVVSLISRIPP